MTSYLGIGAVLSAKAQLDQQLHEAKHHARHVITALHKAQDKIDLLEVNIHTLYHHSIYWSR